MHAWLVFGSRELTDEAGNQKAGEEKIKGKKNLKNNKHEEGTVYQRHALKMKNLANAFF